MTILVADDDPTCRKIVALRLRKLGEITVAEAADGNEAWAMLKHSHFDGLIVDWQMPGRNGLGIVREIRKAGVDMPLLMVTGESEKGRVVEAIRAGVTDYLIKPFDTDTLQAKLEKFVAWLCRMLAAACAARLLQEFDKRPPIIYNPSRGGCPGTAPRSLTIERLLCVIHCLTRSQRRVARP